MQLVTATPKDGGKEYKAEREAADAKVLTRDLIRSGKYSAVGRYELVTPGIKLVREEWAANSQ